MFSKSPFAMQKALAGIGGEPKSVKRLRSGDLLIETNSALQTKYFLLAKTFLNSPLIISPHKTLNSCRGLISEPDLLTTPESEILDGFSDQGVTQSDSKLCSKWKFEKKIQEIKTSKNISYAEARKLILPEISQTYSQATKSSTTTTTTQTDGSITKIVCPPLELLQPLTSVPKPTKKKKNEIQEIEESAQNCQVIYSQFGLAIHQNDHQARRRFVEWAQNEIAVVPDFRKRILFSDEAHFWLNGYVNKQNCRIWSEANPQVYGETPLHPEKLTVWCALWAGGIIGPYFFKNNEGHNVTANGDRYRAMITNISIPELNNHDIQELWFQQDGATCHTARATIDLLKDTFGDRLISRFGPVNWPPRSCDLTPLHYFLWGYVKSLVYADKPQTLDHLEDNIRRVIVDIRPQMLEKVIKNWTSRLDYIRASRGSSMPEIIFKM
ncbi:uncharacterized protein TNCV_5123691 [Trichonephila clavipes]|nr:uncharacterized protein TNCV_5123691 [Trichonephila clavipes]